jgi:hypothetical protein
MLDFESLGSDGVFVASNSVLVAYDNALGSFDGILMGCDGVILASNSFIVAYDNVFGGCYRLTLYYS